MEKELDQITLKIEEEIDALAQTSIRHGEYWRAGFTPEDKASVELLTGWLRERGFQTYTDCAGNLFGRIEGKEPGVILTGGHRDTVKHDGKYGSGLGCITALEAVTELVQELGQPKKTVEVVFTSEEEGSRFFTGFSGSRAIAGVLTEAHLKEKDADGITLEQAMTDAGYFKGELPSARKDIEHFVSLSPEQGQVMLRSMAKVGLVQSVVGMLLGRITIHGEQNHAGTTPMSLRHDPVVMASKIVVDMTKWARNRNDRVACTFGNVRVWPGKYNTIAGEVELTFDFRSPREALLREAQSLLKEFCVDSKGKVTVEYEIVTNDEPADMDIDGVLAMRDIAAERKMSYMRLDSGAGQDAQILAHICPCNMIFVPSEKGIAHSPLEHTAREDFADGYVVLREYLRKLAWD